MHPLLQKGSSTTNLFVCSAPVTRALSPGDTIKLSYPGFSGISVATASDVVGIAAVSPVDGAYRQGANTSTKTVSVNPALTTTNPNDLLFGAVGSNSTFAASNAFVANSSLGGVATAYLTANATQAFTIFGNVTSGAWRGTPLYTRVYTRASGSGTRTQGRAFANTGVGVVGQRDALACLPRRSERGGCAVEDPREVALREFARTQHDVFSFGQAVESGFTKWAVQRRVASCRWEQLDTRAYRVTVARAPSARQLLIAATLASSGVASGPSAAALHAWSPFPGRHEVTVRRGARPVTHARVRMTDALPRADITTVEGIRATTPARTLIDLGGVLPFAEFEDMLEGALLSGDVRAHRLETRARELWAPRRSGCAVVLRLLETRHPELAHARNLWEAQVLRMLDRHRVPTPRVNYSVRIGGRMRCLDLAWPEHKVFGELDGFDAHSRRRVFDDDRVRQNLLVADDWRPFRLTYTALSRDPGRAIAPLLDMLNARPQER
jgi:very-short-patch-repair endonuclease